MGTEEKYRHTEADRHTRGQGRPDREAHTGHSMEAEAEEVTRAGHNTESEHEAGAYAHTHSHAYTHAHTHSHAHSHAHAHTHKNTKAVLDRLARAIGHLEKVRLMVEDGEDCSAVLIQLSAVKSAINNTGKLILKDHMEHCMVEAVKEGDFGAIEELTRAIDQFVK